MLTTKRTDSSYPDFALLIKELDKDLNERYGLAQAEYSPLNKVDAIKNVVVVYYGGQPAGCGCFKRFGDNFVEMKRVFVDTQHRNKGIATNVMAELEKWAAEEGYSRAVLETGTRQHEAIKLYEKIGYRKIPNFPPYDEMEFSVCYEKRLG
ncbi:MAG TPA: GNAT family N-acetyltransferase [Bacteroidia bacterium]|nr:GNAT family N-acetyltransferase [Bacteroidia bacterium]